MAKLQMDQNIKKQPKTADEYYNYAKSIFNCAEEYYRLISVICTTCPNVFVQCTSATITNIAFSCELYLKSMLVLEKQSLERGHSLDELYQRLDNDNTKLRIRDNTKSTDFDLELKELGKSFEVSRYVYEYTEMACNVIFLTSLIDTLRSECMTLLDEKGQV